MIVIVMLSIHSKGLCQGNNTIPLRGDLYKSDTVYVKVPIEWIKTANAKMIERDYFATIINKQDTIIKYKDEYINKQDDIIFNLQHKISISKRTNYIVGGAGAVSVLAFLITLIVK